MILYAAHDNVYVITVKTPVPPSYSQLVTVQQTLAIIKETPDTLDHRLWTLLPLQKFWGAQNISSGEKGSFKVHRRYNSANASSWALKSAWPTQKFERWTTDRAGIKRCCTNFGGAFVTVLRADTK